MVIKKQSIFSKLKEIIENKKENSKYIDDSIVSIIQEENKESRESKFKSEIEIKNIPNVEIDEPRRIKNVEHQDKVPTDIGG